MFNLRLQSSFSRRMSAADALKHPWFIDQKSEGHTLSKSKSKMKKFLARRKWQVCIKRVCCAATPSIKHGIMFLMFYFLRLSRFDLCIKCLVEDFLC